MSDQTPASPTPATPTPPSPVLRRTLLIVGSVVAAGLIGGVVVTGVSAATRTDASRQVTIDQDFESIDLTAEVADVTVERGTVTEPVLTFEQNNNRRNMTFDAEVVGETLRVSVIEHGGGWWLPGDFGRSPHLTIVLPDSQTGVDFTADSDVGDVSLAGDFGKVEFVGTAGDLRLAGSADTADLETTAGEITADRFRVGGDFRAESSVGDITAELASAPAGVTLVSNVGELELRLPRGQYRVETSTNVGDVHVDIADDPDADTLVRLETTVGDISVHH